MTNANNPDDDDPLLAPPERQTQIEDMWQMLTAIGIAARHEENTTPRPSPKVTTPLTILSGFLGAGKTTLLNELLSADHGHRLAVIVNDFGAVNIDASLIRTRDAGVIGLSNGCVCCTNSGQLGDTLDRLIARDPPPDAIVLESSGVADPLNTAHIVLVNQGVRLDAVVTIVDSETVRERLDDSSFGDLVKRQLEAADMLVLNKSDLLTSDQMFALADWLGEHFPNATPIEAEHGRVPAELLLATGLSRLAVSAADADPLRYPHASFETWSFSAASPLDRAAFTELLSCLPESIVRGKGILQFADEPDRQTIFQAVGRRREFDRGDRWGKVTPQSDLVLIGAKNSIDAEEFESRFRQTVADVTAQRQQTRGEVDGPAVSRPEGIPPETKC